MSDADDAIKIALLAAAITALLAAFVPADLQLDRYFKHWLKKKHRWYRTRLVVLHLAVTAIVAGGASTLGWVPIAGDDAFKAAAMGVSWAVTALALLRAEFPGFKVSEASPGFSLLRSISTNMVETFSADVSEAVRNALPNDKDSLRDAALRCKTRAYPPRSDGTMSPDASALSASIALLWTDAGNTAADRSRAEDAKVNLAEIAVQTVTKHRLTRCW